MSNLIKKSWTDSSIDLEWRKAAKAGNQKGTGQQQAKGDRG